MQCREGAGLNGERPGKGGAAGSGRNEEALGASLRGACRRWSHEVPFIAVKVFPVPRRGSCASAPQRVSWRKVESERGGTHVGALDGSA